MKKKTSERFFQKKKCTEEQKHFWKAKKPLSIEKNKSPLKKHMEKRAEKKLLPRCRKEPLEKTIENNAWKKGNADWKKKPIEKDKVHWKRQLFWNEKEKNRCEIKLVEEKQLKKKNTDKKHSWKYIGFEKLLEKLIKKNIEKECVEKMKK